MPLGVIQSGGGHTPGTVLLLDNHEVRAAARFKHGRGKVSRRLSYFRAC